MAIKAVGFDLFDTLVTASADGEACLRGIYDYLYSDGLEAPYETFVEAYRMLRKQQREARQAQHREVTNSESICGAADLLGHSLDPTSRTVRQAVRAYFQPWSLELRKGAFSTLKALRQIVKLGLVTNFTDVAFVEECLTTCGIHDFFDAITVSADCGWRKPSPRIFQVFLTNLGVSAMDCLFVGDDLESAVRGAKQAGMLVAYLAPGQPLRDNIGGADHVIHSLEEVVPLVREML